MYKKIAVPVDLFHVGDITKALDVAADLAKHYGASLHVIGITAEPPTAVEEAEVAERAVTDMLAAQPAPAPQSTQPAILNRATRNMQVTGVAPSKQLALPAPD